MLRNLFARNRRLPIVPGNARCEHIQPRLLSYLDRALDPVERSLIEKHLRQCASCRTELAEFQRAEEALGGAAAAMASPGDLRPEFYARLAASRRAPSRIRWGYAVPVAVCAGLLLLLVRFVPTRMAPDSGPMGDPASRQIARIETRPLHRSRNDAAIHNLTLKSANPTASIAKADTQGSRRWNFRSRAHGKLQVALRRKRLPTVQETYRVAALLQEERRKTAGLVDKVSSALTTLTDTSSLSFTAADYSMPGDSQADRGSKAAKLDLAKSESKAKVVLSNFEAETELHVSDENRDFMASTHIDTSASLRAIRETVRVDDNNESAQETVELPALP